MLEFMIAALRSRHTLSVLVLAAGIGLFAAPPLPAHHAFAAEFDSDKPVQVEGVVTRVRWVNPHSWLYLDVTGPDGKVTNWGFEFGTPNALARAGLSKEDVQAGVKVTISGFLAKNGGPYGYSVILTLPDGRSVRTGGAGDAPTAASPARDQGGP